MPIACIWIHIAAMVTNKLQELAKYQKKIAALEKELGAHHGKLRALPGKFGYQSIGELIGALHAADKTGGAARGKNARKAARHKRTKITPEMKQKLKGYVEAGKTGSAIAKLIGISLPSVQNIKNELGLVKKRK